LLEILGKSLNGILLGTKRNEIGEEILNNPGYFLEFDRKNKVQSEASLITISVLDRKEFICIIGGTDKSDTSKRH